MTSKKSQGKKLAVPDAKRVLERAKLLQRHGKLQEAMDLLQSIPATASVRVCMGEIFGQAGRWTEALACFQAVLAEQPKQALAQAQHGEAAFHLGQLPLAEQSFAAAVGLDPKFAAAWRNLAVVRHQLDDYSGALEAYLSAYALDPRNPQTTSDLATLFSRPEIYHLPACLEPQPHWLPALRALLQDAHQGHQGLAPVVAAQILARQPELSQPERDPLLLDLLGAAINVNLDLEAVLRSLRSQLMAQVREDIALSGDHLKLLAAMAQQAFNNEYVWSESEQDAEFLDACLPNLVEASIEHILAYAMYRPLHVTPVARALLALPRWKGPLKAFSERCLREPLLERELAAKLPRLTQLSNPTSLAVQEQYEQHPFPRWTNIARRHSQLTEAFQRFFPHLPVPTSLAGKHAILIAGCGTGQHPITVALGNPTAEVLAIDLSRTSLAYGQRMAQALGVRNLSFAQADLLELAGWEQRFTHIESVGVLHHMADPLAGWAVLRSLLAPQGTMRIGLYSERARVGVVQARQLIESEGIRPDLNGIRSFRDRIIKDPELAPLRRLLLGLDFFSTSTLRDLIFHVSEQRYTPLRLAKELEHLKLRLLGFELQDRSAHQAYAKRFPEEKTFTNLNHWDEIEQALPFTFTNMYTLWCKSSWDWSGRQIGNWFGHPG